MIILSPAFTTDIIIACMAPDVPFMEKNAASEPYASAASSCAFFIAPVG